MRALVAAVLVVALAGCEGSCSAIGGRGLGGPAIGGVGLGPAALPTPTGCGDFPCSGLVYLFDADDLTGLADTDLIASWENDPSASGGDASQATDAYKPTYGATTAPNSKPAVMFDGTADRMSVTGSAADTAFFHNNGIYDFILVFRKDKTGAQSIVGNTVTGTDEGFDAFLTTSDVMRWVLVSSTGTVVAHDTVATFANGSWHKFEAYGNGSSSFVSTDMSTFAEKAFTGTLGTGNSLRDMVLGNHVDSGTTGSFFDGGIALLLIYDRVLSSSERTQIKNAINARYGI